MRSSRRRFVFLLVPALLVGACGEENQQDDMLEATLRAYAITMRWSELDQAIGFINPADLQANPMSKLELERYRQVRVVGYQEQGVLRPEPGLARQNVTIEIVNQHTQIARTVVDLQEWRYDPVTKKWWLTSGLPKLTAEDTR